MKFISALLCVLTLGGPCLAYSKADFNRDEIVDLLDFGEFADEWLKDPNELPPAPRTKGTATILIAASNAPTDVKAVADYVCTGSGDQNTIMDAYHSLPDFIGGAIHFSVGDFNCSGPIEINDHNRPCSLIGAAFLAYWPTGPFYSGGTAFHLTANKQLLNYGWRHDTGERCNWSCGEIKHIWFDGSNFTDANTMRMYGVLIDNKGDTLIEHCMFHKFHHNYALCLLNHASWVRDCDFENNYGGIAVLNIDNWIQNCQFISNTTSVYPAIGTIASIYKLRLWIEDCYFYADGDQQIVIGGNAGDVFISKNYFYLWSSNKNAITLSNTDSNLVIAENIFASTGSGTYGIYGTSNYSALTIVNNIYSGIGAKSIYLPGQLTNCRINNNIGADETLSATGNAQTFETTHLSGALASQTITLPDGYAVGCRKTFNMDVNTNAMTLSVTHHQKGNPNSIIFNDVNDYLVLQWNGRQWIDDVNGINP